MIQELLVQGWSKEAIIEWFVALGGERVEVEFSYAIVTGEISGDMIEIDEDGNKASPPIERLL